MTTTMTTGELATALLELAIRLRREGRMAAAELCREASARLDRPHHDVRGAAANDADLSKQ